MGVAIIGSGKALPSLEIANDELRALVDTNDEWIRSRTGISSRRIALDETAHQLACAAASEAMGIECDLTTGLDCAGWCERSLDPASIDLVIYATVTPDVVVPSCAALVKRTLGLENAVAFDINAACTGFIYGLSIAESMIMAAGAQPGRRNPIRRALVIGADRLSRITDWHDRNTCVLFGDGAGAAVIEWREDRPGILSSYLRNDDDIHNALTCANAIEAPQPFVEGGIDADAPEDGSLFAADEIIGIAEAVGEGGMRQVIRMDGRSIFKFASNAMAHAVQEVLARAEKTTADVACIIPHQANERIIKFAAKKLDLPLDLFQLSIAGTGNTSSASAPMALADAYSQGRIKQGDLVVMVAFGGGLTSGAVLFEA